MTSKIDAGCTSTKSEPAKTHGQIILRDHRPVVPVLFPLIFLTLTCVIRAGAQVSADDVPEANPARPTVATPATLTPVGYLQFENGVLYAAGSQDFSSRFAVNQVTKLAVTPRLQFLVQSEPFVHSGLSADKQINPGDVLAGFQAVLLPGHNAHPTIAVSYFKHLYAGSAPDIDIGTPEHSVLLLISEDLAGFHFDLNGMFNEQTDRAGGRGQFGQSISISRPLKKFTVAAELWHFTQPFSKVTRWAIFGQFPILYERTWSWMRA